MNRIPIWSININPLRKTEIVDLIEHHIDNTNHVFHLTGVNPETVSIAQKNPELKKAINDSDIVNIDNMLIVCCLRIMGYKIPERAACPDIFEQLLHLSDKKGYSIYFLGAEENILKRMITKLKIKYPNLNIVGSRNGYFKVEEELVIIEGIRKLNPDMLFIALPTPQKELFIYHHKSKLGTRFAFGVGGAFDVQAEKVVRAPEWMRNIGLEGIHRAMQNPLNYGKRYFTLYPTFIGFVIKELFKRKKNKRNQYD